MSSSSDVGDEQGDDKRSKAAESYAVDEPVEVADHPPQLGELAVGV